jgi:uncharacterized protein (TIGR00255 family)
MLRSMTGFGSGRAAASGEEISVEVRSLNHKFCEVKTRLPRELSTLEASLTKRVKDKVARGSVDVSIRRQVTTASPTAPQLDVALAREYRRVFAELAAATGILDSTTVAELASQPGVIRAEERTVDLPAATEAVGKALEEALELLLKMRQTEGQAIYADIDSRLRIIEDGTRRLKELAPQAVHEYRTRLTDRIAELAKDVSVDPQRLAQEVAIFAERSDVAEEMTRLSSHLVQFRQLMASTEPAGRKMDFLVQEMHREVNTTGSKSQHAEISTVIVGLKAELERIREQVQNVE